MKRSPNRPRADDLRPEYDFSKLRPADRSKYPRYMIAGAVSSKGQITLPALIREKLGLVPGSHVIFEILQTGVLVRKSGSKDN